MRPNPEKPAPHRSQPTSLNGRRQGTPNPTEIQERQRLVTSREYEKRRANCQSVNNPPATAKKNYDKRPKSSAYASIAPSQQSQNRPGVRRAQKNTGSNVGVLKPNGKPSRPLRDRISPSRRCHRPVTKIRACLRSMRTLLEMAQAHSTLSRSGSDPTYLYNRNELTYASDDLITTPRPMTWRQHREMG